jgi:ATP-binding cassette subfamily B multidrug efflux pump
VVNVNPSVDRQSDWRLFLRLWPYIRAQRQNLWLPFVLLVPLSLANALQPILIGQAISLIRRSPLLGFCKGDPATGAPMCWWGCCWAPSRCD